MGEPIHNCFNFTKIMVSRDVDDIEQLSLNSHTTTFLEVFSVCGIFPVLDFHCMWDFPWGTGFVCGIFQVCGIFTLCGICPVCMCHIPSMYVWFSLYIYVKFALYVGFGLYVFWGFAPCILHVLPPLYTSCIPTGWKSGTPQKIVFVEELTSLMLDNIPDFWKLGQAYFSGSLFINTKEVIYCMCGICPLIFLVLPPLFMTSVR